jgi:hypothetical protein
MAIKLVWTNPNIVAVTTKIYRGDTPINTANLAALTPIATLTAGETQYVDSDAQNRQRYYYVFSVSSSNDTVISRNYEFWGLPNSGPGGQVPLIGDYEFGYFGELTTAELFTGTELCSLLNFNTATFNSLSDSMVWYKIARKGRFLYIPAIPIRVTLSWSNLYDAGLIYGVNGSGPYNSGTPRDQMRTVARGAHTFIVRTIRGASDGSNGLFTMPATQATPPLEGINSEWDDVMYPLFSLVPSTQRVFNYANRSFGDLQANSYLTLSQERIDGNLANCLVRGTRTVGLAGLSSLNSQAITLASSVGWRPVLELVNTANINLAL